MPRPPSKPTAAQTKAIAASRGMGLTWEKAAWAAGVSPVTVRSWREKGEEGEEPYAAFLSEVEKARADWIDSRLQIIQAAAKDPKHWTAAAWLLERTEPQSYGRRIQEIQGRDGGPVKFEVEWQKPIGGENGSG